MRARGDGGRSRSNLVALISEATLMKIVIGNKNYSSWSMRPWLALQHAGAPFEEILVPLDAADTAANIAK